MVTFLVVALAEVWPRLVELARENHALTGVAEKRFDPDVDGYLWVDERGGLRTHVMQTEPSLLEPSAIVGYEIFCVQPHLHYRGELWAVQDALYVQPAYSARDAWRFMRWGDEQLRAEGVRVVARQETTRRRCAPILERMGYREDSRVFLRRLA